MKPAIMILFVFLTSIAGMAGCSFVTDFEVDDEDTGAGDTDTDSDSDSDTDTDTDTGSDSDPDADSDSSTDTGPAFDRCLIDSVPYPNTVMNPDNFCLICNTAIATDAWSYNNGQPCNDGLFCTINDACHNGTCTGAPNDCPSGIACQEPGTCDEPEGGCVPGPHTCTDGKICSSDGQCIAECNTCWIDGVCYQDNDPKNDEPCKKCDVSRDMEDWTADAGASCSDSNNCTTGDVCDTDGACVGTAVDCSGYDDQCNEGTCNDTDGSCFGNAINQGGFCDDSNACTNAEVCSAGACIDADTAGDVNCTHLDDDCNQGTCDPSDGNCGATAINDSDPCDDLDACTIGEICVSGSCTDLNSANDVDCSGLTETCVIGTCDSDDGSCHGDPTNEGGTCDDGDDCTPDDETCQSGVCVPTATFVFFEDFRDNSQSWELDTDSDWSIGATSAADCTPHGSKPASDHTTDTTDDGVAAVLLGSCIDDSSTRGLHCITSPIINTSSLPGDVWLRYWRQLGSSDDTSSHTVEATTDGTVWTSIYTSASDADTSWQFDDIDITAYKDANTQIRWCYRIDSTASDDAASWTIDDVTIGPVACTPPAP